MSAGGSCLAVTLGLAEPADSTKAAWASCNNMGMQLVALSIDPSINYLLDGHNTAYGMMEALAGHFSPADQQGGVRLLERLFTMKLHSTSLQSVDEFFKEYKEVQNGLKLVKLDLGSTQTSAHLMSCLPQALHHLRTSIGVSYSGPGKSLPSPDEIMKLVRNEALQVEQSTALVATSATGRSGRGGTIKCYACAGAHHVKDCTHAAKKAEWIKKNAEYKAKLASKKNNNNNTGGNPSANLAVAAAGQHDDNDDVQAEGWFTVDSLAPKDVFCMDSGASHHFTNNKAYFASYKSCATRNVTGAAGSTACIGEGTIHLLATVPGGKQIRITLENVWYVPAMGASLVSISQLDKKGFSTNFCAGEVKILNTKNNIVGHGALTPGNLYKLHATVTSSAFNALGTIASGAVPLTTWHRRFGHLSAAAIQTLSTNNSLLGFNLKAVPGGGASTFKCGSCLVGKAHRLPFSNSTSRASARLELVYSDVLEINHASLSGRHYVVTFTDDFSRKSWVYPMGKKSEVFGIFQTWLALVERQSGCTLQVLGSDPGGEYTSNALKTFLAARGIRHIFTEPANPESNSRAERYNRTLLEGTITMLEDSGLPRSLWAEAMLTLVLIKNKSPHRALKGNIPDALWTTKPVNVSFLRAFGCAAWVATPKDQRRKLDAKARPVIMVGYEPNVKAYRLWDPVAKNITISRHVVFDETHLPLGTRGGGQLNSAPPSVCPAAPPCSESDVLLTSPPVEAKAAMPAADPALHTPVASDDESDHDGPIVPPAPRRKRMVHHNDIEPMPPLNLVPNNAHARSESPDPIDLLGAGNALIAQAMAAAGDLLGDEDTFSLPSSDPKSWKEALASTVADHWEQARDTEIASLEGLKCWDVVDEASLPKSTHIVGSKFVWRTKRDKRGRIHKYKARLVAQGFNQKEGVDFNETFAPVAKFTSIRTLVALAAAHNLHLEQADVDSAFPQAELPDHEVIHMRVPLGMRHLPQYAGKILRLKKALYGLKQSGRAWNIKAHTSLTALGYRRSKSDSCIYFKATGITWTYIALYVDDLLLVGPDMAEIKRVKEGLAEEYGIKDLGPAEFILGIQIMRSSDGTVTLSQKAYLEEVLKRFGMADCRPLATPMEPNLQLEQSLDEPDPDFKRKYLQGIGSVLYAMTGTRPDIGHAVSYLARFSARPTNEHWLAFIHLLRYLRGTLDYGICYKPVAAKLAGLNAYSDADWGADINTSRSTMGYVFTICGGAVSWSSTLQSRVTTSSTEAEYLALSHASKEAIYLNQLLEELGHGSPGAVTLFGDNQGANALSKDARFHKRTKHLRLTEHFVREMVHDGIITVQYIPTQEMVADVLTKALARPAFEKCRLAMGVIQCTPP